jgi:uncharacterized protein YecT (DUF1311 family)
VSLIDGIRSQVWRLVMIRTASAFLLLGALFAPVRLLGQREIRDSRLDIITSSRPCPSRLWCFSMQVSDASSTQPVARALVSVAGCASLVADTAGRVEAQCLQAGTVGFLVRQIGYLPARTAFPVELGQSYVATATLASLGRQVVGDPFPFPCEDWDAMEDQQRCLVHELSRAQHRLSAALDSARAIVEGRPLLDSAQDAWARFMNAHCKLQASLVEAPDAAAIAELSCRLSLTGTRTWQLEGMRFWQRRREPPNER